MEIKFKGILTRAQYRDCFKLLKQPLSKLIQYSVIILVAVIYMILDVYLDKTPQVVLLIAVMLLTLFFDIWFQHFRRADMYYPVLPPNTKGPLEEIVNDSCITFTARNYQTRAEWSAFGQHHGSDQLMLLYLNPGSFFIVARNYFANDADWNAFVELVKSKVPAR